MMFKNKGGQAPLEIRRRRCLRSLTGQAAVEMAVFGSIILLIFSVLLSYTQRLNDQQYLQMETFRRALEKAETFQDPDAGGGASVQLSLIQDRHHFGASSGFKKGSPQRMSASSNVYWAVPKVDGTKSYSFITYRVNEDQDEITILYDYGEDEKGDEKIRIFGRELDFEFDYDPEDEDFKLDDIFRTEDMSSTSVASFKEQIRKQETHGAITNKRASWLKRIVTTTIRYSVGPEEPEEAKDVRVFWAPEQGLYRDSDGQYKYSESTVGTEVGRGRTWRTAF